MVPQKHKAPTKFVYNSGFFITTNIYPDFGAGLDGEAIRKRLAVFETKSLPSKDTTVSGKCVLWHNRCWCLFPFWHSRMIFGTKFSLITEPYYRILC